MLTVRGRYVDGRILLLEPVPYEGEVEVLITFLGGEGTVTVARDDYEEACAALAREACPLTKREYEVLQLLQRGLTNQEIALELGLSPGTIRNYTSSLYDKLGVRNRLAAVTRAVEIGLLTMGDGG